MKIFLVNAIEYNGRAYKAGVHEIPPQEATGFYIRGGRPATAAESVAHDAEAETAQAKPSVERAAISRGSQPRVRIT